MAGAGERGEGGREWEFDKKGWGEAGVGSGRASSSGTIDYLLGPTRERSTQQRGTEPQKRPTPTTPQKPPPIATTLMTDLHYNLPLFFPRSPASKVISHSRPGRLSPVIRESCA